MCVAEEVMEDKELVHYLDKPLSAVDFGVFPSRKRRERERDGGKEREREVQCTCSKDFTTCYFF